MNYWEDLRDYVGLMIEARPNGSADVIMLLEKIWIDKPHKQDMKVELYGMDETGDHLWYGRFPLSDMHVVSKDDVPLALRPYDKRYKT